uniref:G-protein coupled receptors family 1 profile domain-containing protein n=1 Tax=Arion vulgaris TaxID=1028688 RepID=A0A0B7A1A8_9EUPU
MVVFLMAITIVFTVCYAPLMVRVIMNQILNTDMNVIKGGFDDMIDIWALRLACLNQILDPWVYIISRVACCKGANDRNRDILSQSTRSYHAVSFVHADNKLPVSNSHETRTKENHITIAFHNIRYLFGKKSFNPNQKDTVTIPLQSTTPPPHGR